MAAGAQLAWGVVGSLTCLPFSVGYHAGGLPRDDASDLGVTCSPQVQGGWWLCSICRPEKGIEPSFSVQRAKLAEILFCLVFVFWEGEVKYIGKNYIFFNIL